MISVSKSSFRKRPFQAGIFGIPGSYNDVAISDIAEKLYRSGQQFVFTEEHYCLPNRICCESNHRLGTVATDDDVYANRSYDIGFDEEKMKRYDLVVYMEIDPAVISENLQFSEDSGHVACTSLIEIRLWQLFELDNIQRLCNESGIPLFYIYDYANTAIELDTILSHYLKHNRFYTTI